MGHNIGLEGVVYGESIKCLCGSGAWTVRKFGVAYFRLKHFGKSTMSDTAKSQDKKTKKKKSTKPGEEKAKEMAEEVKQKSAEEAPAVTAVEQPQEEETSKQAPEPVAEEPPKDEPGHAEPEPESVDNVPEPKIEPLIEKPKTFEEMAIEKKKKTAEKKAKDVKLEMDKLIELKEAFSLFDINHDGFIDLEDLRLTFATLGKPDMPEEQLKQMLGEMPDPVDFDAFVGLFGQKITELDPEDVFTGALANWDTQGDGMILEQRIKDDLLKFGDRFTPKEVDCALEEAPVYVKEGIAMIDYVKFGRNVCGLRNVRETRVYQAELEKAGTS